MRKLVAGSLLLGTLIGDVMNLRDVQPAKAANYQIKKLTSMPPTSYCAKNNKSGYLWNKTHTKRLHNLKNYPKTTWYATGKYSMESPKNSGNYLKVANGSGKATGYVWTGYLKKGVNPAYPQGTLTDPFGASMSTYNVDNKLNKQLVSLFPDTIVDKNLQLAANYSYIKISGDNGDYFTGVIEQMVGIPNQPSVLMFGTDAKISKSDNFTKVQKKALSQKLSAEGKTFNSFKGYHIGAYAYPKHDKQYGSTLVLLLPSK